MGAGFWAGFVFVDFCDDLGDGGGGDEADAAGVIGHGLAIGGEDHGDAVGGGGIDGAVDEEVARGMEAGIDVTNVDGTDAVGAEVANFRVDGGVLLAGIADEHEGEARVAIEEGQGFFEFVAVAFFLHELGPVEAEVAQEDGPARDVVELDEIPEEVMQVPRGAGDVEERVEGCPGGAFLEGGVEFRDAVEGLAGFGVFEEGELGR